MYKHRSARQKPPNVSNKLGHLMCRDPRVYQHQTINPFRRMICRCFDQVRKIAISPLAIQINRTQPKVGGRGGGLSNTWSQSQLVSTSSLSPPSCRSHQIQFSFAVSLPEICPRACLAGLRHVARRASDSTLSARVGEGRCASGSAPIYATSHSPTSRSRFAIIIGCPVSEYPNKY